MQTFKPDLQRIALLLFLLSLAGFMLFFLAVGQTDTLQIQQTRPYESYIQLTDYTYDICQDASAPAGVYHTYRWDLSEAIANDSSLCILTAHQSLQVQIGGELVYSMSPDDGNRLSQSTGTHWSTIPLSTADSGAEVIVTVIPLFSNVADYGADFWYGSHHNILFDQFTGVLGQMLVAILCMVLGICIVAVQAYINFSSHNRTWNMMYLGSFSFLLGLWYLTYQDPFTILYGDSTIIFQYITIGSLFLLCIPLGLYAGTSFRNSRALFLMSILTSCTSLAVLVMQLLGIRDMKENLTLSHILLVLTVVMILIAALTQTRDRSRKKRMYFHFLFLGAGVLMDVVLYNIGQRSAGLIFTVLAFFAYTTVLFASGLLEISHNAYRDSNTGLPNRMRWNELMQSDSPFTDSCAILVMDLNGLKMVNDTLGHDAGDRMIFNFANILRNTLPRASVICRWGGDEFAALLTDIRREQLDAHLAALNAASVQYNEANPQLPIHFAIGTALSAEHPGLKPSELFQLADENMYQYKQTWYADNPDAVRS